MGTIDFFSVLLQVFPIAFELHVYRFVEANRVYLKNKLTAWWLIPLSKWVITPVINGISRVNPHQSLG